MARKTVHFAGMCVAAVLVTTSLMFSQDRSKLQGWRPYTPSRLEWLAVELNAGNHVELNLQTLYSISFVPIENEDAILVYVVYLPTIDRALLNLSVENAKELIAVVAKNRGWSSWLKVKEKVQVAELNEKK